uniref:Uncharacterized protein n=1 Tax=viral metagenome TaxID=1070528 RepID=A0A6C0B8J3_9ZZZZ
MKTIRDTCIEFFQSEDLHKEVREIIKPLGNMMYNEIYLYIWFICVYNVLLLFLILANLFLIIHLYQSIQKTNIFPRAI